MIIILLGAPGSGKGTQAQATCARFGLTHLATGDVFRAEIAAKTPLGLKVADYVKSGKLVPDDLVTELVAAKLDGGGKYLLDGFPRNIEQAQVLADILRKNNASIDAVIFLKIAREEVAKRLTARRICPKCNEVYNLLSRRPASEGVCDKCGAQLEQRADDAEATVNRRLMVFEDLTQPLIAYYKAENIFHEVDASKSPEQVAESVATLVEEAVGWQAEQKA